MNYDDKFAVTVWRSHNNKLNYHVERLSEFLEAEKNHFLFGHDTGYRLVGVFDTYEEAMDCEPLGPMFSNSPQKTKCSCGSTTFIVKINNKDKATDTCSKCGHLSVVISSERPLDGGD